MGTRCRSSVYRHSVQSACTECPPPLPPTLFTQPDLHPFPPCPRAPHLAAAVRLSATGVPKVFLDDRRAFAYDGRMRCWMQITYDELRGSAHCASAGMPIRPLANGEGGGGTEG